MSVQRPARAGMLTSLIRSANQNSQGAAAKADGAQLHDATAREAKVTETAPPPSVAAIPGLTRTEENGLVQIKIDPAKTRMNELHRRSAATMSGESIDELVRLIKAGGQAVPALGWRLARPEADGTEVILIYGARRRAATLQLGIELDVAIMPREPLRADVIRLMHAENRGRKNYLPLEDAREYEGYLKCGAYANASALAADLEVDKSTLSRLLSLLTLPDEVLAIYTNPAWLQLAKGASMASEAKDPVLRAKLIRAANEFRASGRDEDPTATLQEAIHPRSVTARSYELKSGEGKKLGVLSPGAGGKGGLVLKLGSDTPVEVCRAVTELLKKHFPQAGL